MHPLRGWLASAAALLALAANSSAAAEPIRIGVSGPLTGGSAPMGISMHNGVRLAAEQINARGGLLGRPIALIERDDHASEELGARIARDFVDKERVVAVVGIVNTGVALASQYRYQEARIPVLTAVATGSLVTRQFLPPRHGDSYVFRVSANDGIQAEMIVRDAVERRRFARVAIIHDTTNYGQLGRTDLEKALARRNLKAVAVERFNLKDVDMTPQLSRAKQAGAQAILTYGIGPELALIANGMVKLGWRVPLIGSWTLSMSSFIDSVGPNAEGARMPQTFVADPDVARSAAFLRSYEARFGSERIPVPSAAAQGYDAMLLLAAAIEQAGTTSGPKIREALENLKRPVDGVVASYARPFTRDDHEAITAEMAVMGELRNGRVVFAYDEDRRRTVARTAAHDAGPR